MGHKGREGREGNFLRRAQWAGDMSADTANRGALCRVTGTRVQRGARSVWQLLGTRLRDLHAEGTKTEMGDHPELWGHTFN